MTEAVLHAQGLVKRYGELTALGGVSIDVRAGEIVALLGPNGAGKSTLFKVLCGVLRPDSGTVRLGNVDVTTWPLHRRAAAGLGWLPQHASVLPSVSVRGHLEMVASRMNGLDIDATLERFHLSGKGSVLAGALSGGERRRLELARCVALNPKVVLLDEPFAGVDPHQRAQFAGIVRAVAATGVGVVLTDHAVKEALDLCDRAMLIEAGVVGIEGTSLQVRQHPEARSRYLGHDFC